MRQGSCSHITILRFGVYDTDGLYAAKTNPSGKLSTMMGTLWFVAVDGIHWYYSSPMV